MAQKIWPKKEQRLFSIERSLVNAKDRTVPLSFSSESPVVKPWGIEVLDHAPGAMRMDRAAQGIPILFNHNRDAHLGIMNGVRCGPDLMGRGIAQFGQSPMATEKFKDVQDGILKDVSVGYMVNMAKEVPAKELAPDLMELAAQEKLPVYRITDWEPFECSMVTVPADPTVGVGRSEEDTRAASFNSAGKSNAMSKVKAGDVDKTSGWSFSAEDGDKLLGDPPDWGAYGKWFMGIDSSAPKDTKGHYKYPFGKDGKVYRSGIIAVKQRGSQQGETEIANAADAVLQEIDKGAEKSLQVDDSVGIKNTKKGDRKMSEEKDQKTLVEIEAEMKKQSQIASNDATAKEKARNEDINKYYWKFRDKVPEFLRDKAISEGMSIEQFRGIVLDKLDNNTPLDVSLGAVGMSSNDVKRYSIMRAIRAAASKDWKGAEFEKECSDQVAKQVGSEARAFYLPYDIMTAKRSRRDLNVTTDADGGFLVATQFLAGSFIELLRAKLVAAKAGVQIMSGLVGNIAIPKLSAASTGYWIETEGTAPTGSQPTIGQVTLTPHNVAAWVDITRNLMKQSTPAADTIVLNDIVAVLARSIDLAVFHGTNANGQPKGIATAAAGSFTGTNFTRTLAVSALTDVMTANADVPTMNWVCNPLAWGILKVREQGTAGYPVFLCDDNDKMLGFPVLVSTQITNSYLFFGDFSQAVIGEWGVLDINVDDKSLSTTGGIRIVGYQSVDVAVRQTGAFTVASNLS